MRICSLLPSATEVIALLGLSDELVGISHECDYPPSIRHLPVMVEPIIPPHGLASHDIDRQVSQLVASGQRLYRLKDQLLRQAQPDRGHQPSPLVAALGSSTYLMRVSRVENTNASARAPATAP